MRRIGRLRSDASPSKSRDDRMAADDAHHQDASRCRHCRNRACRAARATSRGPRRGSTSGRSPCRSICAPSARQASAVRSTSSPSSTPVTRVSPTLSRPKMNARCEMDLSPGTRMRPASAPPRRALRLCAPGRVMVLGVEKRHGLQGERGAHAYRLFASCGKSLAASAKSYLTAPEAATNSAPTMTRGGATADMPEGSLRGQTRHGDQAAVPVVRDEIFRHEPRDDHLPEMRRGVSADDAARGCPRAPLPRTKRTRIPTARRTRAAGGCGRAGRCRRRRRCRGRGRRYRLRHVSRRRGRRRRRLSPP